MYMIGKQAIHWLSRIQISKQCLPVWLTTYQERQYANETYSTKSTYTIIFITSTKYKYIVHTCPSAQYTQQSVYIGVLHLPDTCTYCM